MHEHSVPPSSYSLEPQDVHAYYDWQGDKGVPNSIGARQSQLSLAWQTIHIQKTLRVSATERALRGQSGKGPEDIGQVLSLILNRLPSQNSEQVALANSSQYAPFHNASQLNNLPWSFPYLLSVSTDLAPFHELSPRLHFKRYLFNESYCRW